MTLSGAARPVVGISGFAAYLPCYRVNLQDWCRWTGDSWDKVSSVIGRSFRMRAPDENAYTMAATAVLRLIRAYDVDPRRIGYFALGTESSTDNSIGAVIVKGMVNDGLRELGAPPLGRHCEVPEFKHACLGGVYAMKAAARYVALDGFDKLAIVVCADIAEYARGTSGEATQGAGAVAMLIESQPSFWNSTSPVPAARRTTAVRTFANHSRVTSARPRRNTARSGISRCSTASIRPAAISTKRCWRWPTCLPRTRPSGFARRRAGTIRRPHSCTGRIAEWPKPDSPRVICLSLAHGNREDREPTRDTRRTPPASKATRSRPNYMNGRSCTTGS